MQRSAQTALFLALLTGMAIAVSPVAAQTTTPAPAAAPAPAATNCPAVPTLPPMPDPAHATRAQMDAYNGTYTQWSTAASTAKDCRRAAAEPLRNRAAGMIQEFNTANTRVDAINAYWTAMVNQLNAQYGGQPQQQQHQDGAAASTTTPPATPAPLPDISTLGTGPVTPANSASQCAAIPEPAAPPDIAHMNPHQLQRTVPPAVTAYNTWYTSARAALVCRHDEAQSIGGQADALVTEYNTTSALVASSATQWHDAVAAFNARTGGHH